jgi:type II secretory pathway predicted ATPase ExeA
MVARFAAANDQSSLFDESAIGAIFERSSGVPRDIDRLCELSVLAAKRLGKRHVDETAVLAATEELRGPHQTALGIPLLYEST